MAARKGEGAGSRRAITADGAGASIAIGALAAAACAGVAGGTYLFALPGSPGACKDGWDAILSLQLDYRHSPCNFVEIMPRLEEHKRRK